jgi:hypothetical protein
MFGLFQKKSIENWEHDLMAKVSKSLPIEFNYLKQQIESGLLRGAIRGSKHILNYVGFTYNPEISKRFIDEKGTFFCIKGIMVFSEQGQREIILYVTHGLLCGYSMPLDSKPLLKIERVEINSLIKKYFANEEYEEISNLLTATERERINPADVYEIYLNDKKYYHLKDLEDGDFIGIDDRKKIYKIAHDPFEIIELDGALSDFLG